MLVNVLLANSPPLSVGNFFGDRNIDIQFLKMYLAVVLGCFFGIKTDTESLAQWPIMRERIYLCSAVDPLLQFLTIC